MTRPGREPSPQDDAARAGWPGSYTHRDVYKRQPVMEAQLITCTDKGVFNTVNLVETVIPPLDGLAAKSSFSF